LRPRSAARGRRSRPARALLAAAALARAAAAAEPAPAPPEAAEPAAAAPADPGPASPAPDARAIARRAVEVLRGRGSYTEATLRVGGSWRSRSREIAFRRFDDRLGDRTLVRVVAPENQSGATWLRLPPNLWRFNPADGRTVRLPWPTLLEPWLETELTLDDLLHGSDEIRDYDPRLLGSDERAGERGDRRAHVLEYLPRAGASAAWGRIVAWIDAEHGAPLRQDFYDREGAAVRTLRLDDFREVAGRRFPHLWIVRRLDGPEREARLHIDAVRFDPGFDDALFTTRSLERDPGALHSPASGGEP
jgi:hypothetical protein